MKNTDTIFAPATLVIKSGVCVIRVSGVDALSSLKALTHKNLPKPREAALREIYQIDSDELIDKALIIYFKNPNSFTGEDVVEFHVHGGIAVIKRLLDNLGRIKNYRFAEAGEFSRRAFENGKMDLTEAEGLSDLINAETELQAKQALKQMGGSLKSLYEGWRVQIIEIMANIEAYIDFPEDEIPQDITDAIIEKAEHLKQEIASHLDDDCRGEKLRAGLHTVILGAPNVGKSSLLNLLSKRDVAIVSDIAGTTRDVLEVHLDVAGLPVILFDTAGLREKADVIESEGIRRALKHSENADLKIIIFDGLKLPELDSKTLEVIDENSIILINKSDVIAGDVPQEIKGVKPIAVSIKNEKNLSLVIEDIKKQAENQLGDLSEPVITSQRHRNLLQLALKNLNEFNLNKPAELAGEDLRLAADNIGKITGYIDVEDILDKLFSSFCIGK